MRPILFLLFAVCISACTPNYIPKSYRGRPWEKQSIPGRIECAFYDRGGESVAYHDTDSINHGSGHLNPADGNALHEFRMNEGVDISFTKSGGIDNNPFNKKDPVLGQLYIGWTEPGEWINYTVKVRRSGLYRIAVMYTANGDGAITLDVDGKKGTNKLKIFSTHNDADTVSWRQWHHWSTLDSLTSLRISKGMHIIKLRIAEHGNMNFDYLEFTKK
ncbi:MAG TPA: carbohydrate-binding protein [Puia sp.]|nr:carbohydrate-binding protein [Puia sp.]